MIFLLALVVVAVLVQRWSVSGALNGVEFDYEPSRLLVEPGEPFEIVTRITNRSRRFVPFVRMAEHLPDRVTVLSDNVKVETDVLGNIQHHSTVYLMPRSRLERRLSVSLPGRGRYTLRGAELSGGDFLGLMEQGGRTHQYREVVVVPKPAACPEVSQLLGGFLGDVSVRRFLIEDPVLTVGCREYTGREPMKAISWTHSARSGRLLVKQFDYTLEPSVSVLLDVTCSGGDREALVEQCFSLARSACESLEEKGVKYDFITNASTSNAFAHWSTVSEGLGRRHLMAILEGLGRATLDSMEPLSATVAKAIDLQEGNRSTIAIIPRRGAEQLSALRELELRTGGMVYLIAAEETLRWT